jgi:putative CocE/NonD family hydrolase
MTLRLVTAACCTVVGLAAGASSAIVSQQSVTPDRAATNWMRRYDRAASFDVEYVPNVMVPMRDGVALATALYFPGQDGKRADGPFPVLLTRHMGDSSGSGGKHSTARYFASRGYVVADQTMRGRFRSGGDSFYLYGRQQFDGADAVEWLAKQPWSTGKVGTFGVSHAGVAQYSLATQNPKGLAAMVPAFAQSNYALWSMRTGGALELRYLNWATGAAAVGKEAACDPVAGAGARAEREKFREYLTRDVPFFFPFRKGETPLRFTPSYEDWLLSIVEHSDYPGPDDFWKDPGFNLTPYYQSMADVPTLHHSAWYDTYPRAHSDNWQALAPIKKSPQWLMLGPWTHVSALPRVSGDVDFGPEAEGSYDQVRLSWFDQHLKGIDTGVLRDRPVKIFVMGGGDERKTADGKKLHGGYWREADSWPLPGTRDTRYYFHADGALSTTPPASARSATTFTFDPRHPVPSVGGNVSAFGEFFVPGAFDQVCRDDLIGCTDHLPLARRSDVLVFRTPPLTEDVEVAGYLKVVLHAASSAVDTDFTAKLVDEHPPNVDYPQGYAMNVADGILRARYRNGRDKQVLMEPGTIYEMVVEPYPAGNLFKKGHRIRVDISSSNFPRFDVNPNTGEPILKHRRYVVAENTIYHQTGHGSHIILPVIPRSTPTDSRRR